MAAPDGLTPLVEEEAKTENSACKESSTDKDQIEEEWGFTTEELYALCLKFFKEKEGKAIHVSYQVKNSLVAYIRQITNGKYDPTRSPPVGYFDVVGNDRRRVWQGLGDLSKEDCIVAFCKSLNKECPTLKPYVEAHRREKEEKERIRLKEEERRRKEEEEKERQRLEEEERRKAEEEKQRQEQQRLQLKEAIYEQLLHQVKPLAVSQYPDNLPQQQIYIQQLQELYYQQYLKQVQQQQQTHLVNGTMEANEENGNVVDQGAEALAQNLSNLQIGQLPTNGIESAVQNGPTEEVDLNDGDNAQGEQLPDVAKPSSWTHPDIVKFKSQLAKDSESIIKVGHGETVTVRVPTHNEGKYIFWEFATDYYDVGFGLYFEWSESPSNAISVHVSDSSDEEEDYREDEEGGDVESRGGKNDGPPMDEIIPIYRRDCHSEVYAGCHKYPGRGVYLLKFDNSYSLFRSKTLYYRVYYTKDDPT